MSKAGRVEESRVFGGVAKEEEAFNKEERGTGQEKESKLKQSARVVVVVLPHFFFSEKKIGFILYTAIR